MKQNILILILIVAFSACKDKQQTKYDSLFEETVFFISENYAGFQDKVERRNLYYNFVLSSIRNQSIESPQELNECLNRYIDFFEDKHLKLNNFDLTQFMASGAAHEFKSEEFIFKVLNESTCYIKIPHFNSSSLVNKLLNENMDSISRKKNLIIDIRGNGGGSDASYRNILQIIATNNIYVRNGMFLKTKANWDDKYGIWNDKNEGEFVHLPWVKSKTEMIKTFSISGVNEFPKRVGVIVDNKVSSSGEQFVLCAKQSLKVKIFGENTAGCIDYSNCNQYVILKNSLFLQYPMTKLTNLARNKIDNHGIVPDFYLKSENQIDQVVKYLNYWD